MDKETNDMVATGYFVRADELFCLILPPPVESGNTIRSVTTFQIVYSDDNKCAVSVIVRHRFVTEKKGIVLVNMIYAVAVQTNELSEIRADELKKERYEAAIVRLSIGMVRGLAYAKMRGTLTENLIMQPVVTDESARETILIDNTFAIPSHFFETFELQAPE